MANNKPNICQTIMLNCLFQDILSGLTEEAFDDFKKGLEKMYLDKPKRLSQEALQYWEEVLSGHYNFRRNTLCAQELAGVSLADLLTFHNLFVCADAPERRKLSLAILPAAKVEEAKGEDGDFLIEINSYDAVSDHLRKIRHRLSFSFRISQLRLYYEKFAAYILKKKSNYIRSTKTNARIV